MHATPVVFSLVAAAAASKALHYAVPNNFKALASNCTLPAEFVVTNFTTYADKKDESLNTVCFEFSDPDMKRHAVLCSTPKFEASGLITPELDCTNSTTGTLCHAKQASLQGDFDSLEPIPPNAPTRRARGTWRG